MVTLEIRFLTERYAAGRHTDPTTAEWPPHPARVYSALTAALYDDPEPLEEERAALEWLAAAGAPEVIASSAYGRHLTNVYVPTNDPKALGDIDRYILAHASAEAALTDAEGKARTKAERALAKAHAKLKERSLASAAADGKGTPSNAEQVLDRRPRHARSFPVALPTEDVVYVRWAASASAMVAEPLDRICSRVARLGHSSSLVSMRLVDDEIETSGRVRWVPDPEGTRFLRVPYPEQLRLLNEAHDQHQQIEPRVLPADSVRYSKAGDLDARVELPRPVFSSAEAEWIVYEVVAPSEGGRRQLVDLSLAQQVTRALRGTLLTQLGEDAPESLSGHDRKGRPTTQPHLAFIPLADIGHPHATGSILGAALVPPRDLSTQDRDRLLEAVFMAERAEAAKSGEGGGAGFRRLRLTMGRSGVIDLERLSEPSHLWALTPARWCTPSARWTTATALALGRNPGKLNSRDPEVAATATAAAQRTVAECCVNIGLPAPAGVWIHRRSLLEGAPAARRFMPFPDGGNGPRRVCVHAELVFAERVRGPVLLGAGRFFGLGLCAPARKRRNRADR